MLKALTAKVYSEQEGVDAEGLGAIDKSTSLCEAKKVCATLVKGETNFRKDKVLSTPNSYIFKTILNLLKFRFTHL